MRSSRVLTTASVLLTSCMAHACTVCGTSTGRQVRAGIFDGHFLHTLLLVALPFPAFALAVAAVHLGMPELDTKVRSASAHTPLPPEGTAIESSWPYPGVGERS